MGLSDEDSVTFPTPSFSERTVNISTGDSLLQAGNAWSDADGGCFVQRTCSTKHIFSFHISSFPSHVCSFLISSICYLFDLSSHTMEANSCFLHQIMYQYSFLGDHCAHPSVLFTSLSKETLSLVHLALTHGGSSQPSADLMFFSTTE